MIKVGKESDTKCKTPLSVLTSFPAIVMKFDWAARNSKQCMHVGVSACVLARLSQVNVATLNIFSI